MKNINFIVLLGSIVLSSSSWAYLIADNNADALNGADVGQADTFMDYTTKSSMANSNPETETSWVNSLLNPEVTYTVKTEDVSYYKTTGTGIYAFELQSAPEYFIIKNSTFWALFENVKSLDWGVFDTTELADGFNLAGEDKWQISHVSELNGSTVTVPEPGSMSLLALGLLALGLSRRK